MLTDKSLQSIKELDEHYLWEYGNTLFNEESVLLKIEKAATDSDILIDLTSKAIISSMNLTQSLSSWRVPLKNNIAHRFLLI
jgi:hypothetical protein